MAVKIRLKRLGKIRAPYYRIVVADSRTKRDGRVIEEIGKYHPTENPSVIEVNSERAQYWLGVGAQPTEQVTALLKLTGDWGVFKGEKGARSTVTFAEPKPEFSPDLKKKPVLKPKVKVEKPVEAAPAEAAPVEAAASGEPESAPEVAPEAAEEPVAAPAEGAESAPPTEAASEDLAAEESAAEEIPAEESPAEEPAAEEAAPAPEPSDETAAE